MSLGFRIFLFHTCSFVFVGVGHCILHVCTCILCVLSTCRMKSYTPEKFTFTVDQSKCQKFQKRNFSSRNHVLTFSNTIFFGVKSHFQTNNQSKTTTIPTYRFDLVLTTSSPKHTKDHFAKSRTFVYFSTQNIWAIPEIHRTLNFADS